MSAKRLKDGDEVWVRGKVKVPGGGQAPAELVRVEFPDFHTPQWARGQQVIVRPNQVRRATTKEA